MGQIYQRGLGVSVDAKEARKWYQLSAQHGDADALRALAPMVAKGEGGKADRAAAFLLYAGLALRGDKDIMPIMAKLKKGISAKEWKELRVPLLKLNIDPDKLADGLQRYDTQ